MVHSCLHSGSVKQSVPDLTEDLTRLQDRPEEKTCGTALVTRLVSRNTISTGWLGELREVTVITGSTGITSGTKAAVNYTDPLL